MPSANSTKRQHIDQPRVGLRDAWNPALNPSGLNARTEATPDVSPPDSAALKAKMNELTKLPTDILEFVSPGVPREETDWYKRESDAIERRIKDRVEGRVERSQSTTHGVIIIVCLFVFAVSAACFIAGSKFYFLGFSIVVVAIAALLFMNRDSEESEEFLIERAQHEVDEWASAQLASIKPRLEDVQKYFSAWANENNTVGYASALQDGTMFLCSPLGIAVSKEDGHSLLSVGIASIREVELETRKEVQTAVTSGNLSNNSGSALGGAILGGLTFGDAGMIAGSVIGGSGRRDISTVTKTTTDVHKDMVTIYTRLPEMPVMSFLFSSDTEAKQTYGLLTAAIEANRAG